MSAPPKAPGPPKVADQRIVVVPVDGGWSVLSPVSDTPLMFISGAKAEESAKGLARVVTGLGVDAQVLIHDRSSALVGAIRFFADEASPQDIRCR